MRRDISMQSGADAGGALDVGAALRRLPPALPLRDGWPDLAQRLAAEAAPQHVAVQLPTQPSSGTSSQRRPRGRLLLTMAASLVAAVLLTLAFPLLRPPGEPAADPTIADAPAAASSDALAAWMRESAVLEAQLAQQGTRLAASGDTAWLRSGLTDRVGEVDLLLAASDDPLVLQSLWRERVLLLRQLGALETTDQMLAAHGERELPLRHDWL